MKDKPQLLPVRLRGCPKSSREAERRNLSYYYTMRNNVLRLHGLDPMFEGGRPVGRYSPKFPDESEDQMHVRLYCNVPEDAEVPARGQDKKVTFGPLPREPQIEPELFAGRNGADDSTDKLLPAVMALLSDRPKSVLELGLELGMADSSDNRVKLLEFLRKLVEVGYADKTSNCGYCLAPKYVEKEDSCPE